VDFGKFLIGQGRKNPQTLRAPDQADAPEVIESVEAALAAK